MQRFDLLRLPLVKPALRSRWPQLAAASLALAGFSLVLLAGFLGSPVGSRNFGIVFVWIAWWALLMLGAVPLLGRAWCGVCPLPLPGEWLQRGAVLGPPGAGLSLGRRWPNALRGIWLQNGAFTLVALFSAVVLTQPRVTAMVLAVLVIAAVGLSVIFERRAFCRYLCPVGGFIGLYAQLAPVEVRVRDAAVCAAHTEKTCYTGSAAGYGCPWQVYPGGLAKNTYCGTCLECLRTCPHDNIVLNLRPFGADLAQPAGRRMDEAFKAFLMLGSALVYSAVLLGPWGALKTAAYAVGSWAWLAYAAAFIAFVFGLLPAAFWLAVRLAGRGQLRQRFVALAYSLIPLGLAAWMAFSLSFVFANLSYVWPALSDPLGWGWNLFGTAHTAWAPYLMQFLSGAQALVLVGGLVWAAVTALKISGEHSAPEAARRRAAPVVVFQFAVTAALLGLLIA